MKYFYVEAQDYYFIVVEDEEFHVFVENNSCEFPHREDETDAEFKMRCETWLRDIADDLDTSGAAWDTFPSTDRDAVFDNTEIIAEYVEPDDPAPQYHWWLIDDCGHDIWTQILDCGTRQAAIQEMRYQWEMLSASEKKQRKAFFVGYAPEDAENKIPDYDRMADNVDIKNVITMQFWGGEGRHFDGGVNYLISDDATIYTEVAVPEGASEDYGYLTMKKSILYALEKQGVTVEIEWPCVDEYLPEDANADCDVFLDIDDWEVEGC